MAERIFSCEFFPPADEAGAQRLIRVHEQLLAIKPAYFSVTYGAGGSTQQRTLAAIDTLHNRHGIGIAPHLTCVGADREMLISLLDRYRDQGIQRIVALRGDLPSGSGGRTSGDLAYASELVSLIRQHYGHHFAIEVAAYPEYHPQAISCEADLEHFHAKVDAGADSAITQYFFNADAYFSFIERCQRRGIGIPIVPGIMPIGNYKQLVRFSDGCGAEIPRWIRLRLQDLAEDRESLQAFGIEVVSTLCQRLLDQGAPGLHFYSMNRAQPTLAIWRNLFPDSTV